MMEEGKGQGLCCGGGMCCGCGWHGGAGHGIAFMVLRCLLALVILFVVFWFGVKLGELKGAYGYGYGAGYHGMMNEMMGGYPQYFYQSAPMMHVGTTTAR